MKTILLIFTLLFQYNATIHSEDIKSLVVLLKNGSSITFNIDEMPKITFEGTVMNIATERLQISNVNKYTFNGLSGTDIATIENTHNADVTLDGDKAYIKLPKPDTNVRCYTVDGKELSVSKRNAGENIISINLSEIDQQVFILNVGGESIKIRKP